MNSLVKLEVVGDYEFSSTQAAVDQFDPLFANAIIGPSKVIRPEWVASEKILLHAAVVPKNF